MTLLRIAALAILVGSAAGLVVWFGWGLVARLFAAGATAASNAPDAEAVVQSEVERT